MQQKHGFKVKDGQTNIIIHPNFSRWIISISKGRIKNGRVYISVIADTHKTSINGIPLEGTTTMFGIVDKKEWDLLENGTYSETYDKLNSTGATFYHRWLKGIIQFHGDYKEGDSTPSEKEDFDGDNVLDGSVAKELKEIFNGKLENEEEWKKRFQDLVLEEQEQDRYTEEQLNNWLDRFNHLDDLYQQTLELRKTIEMGQFGIKTAFAAILKDVEGIFGVSISKRFGYGIINSVGLGKLNPNNFVKYKYRIKNMYDIFERDGLRGASAVGRRFVSSHNPILLNRNIYKTSTIGKEIARNRKKTIYAKDSDATLDQILKFHHQSVKQESKGLIKANSLTLVKDKKGNFRWRHSGREKLGLLKGGTNEALKVAHKIPVIGKFARTIDIVNNASFLKGMINKKDKK